MELFEVLLEGWKLWNVNPQELVPFLLRFIVCTPMYTKIQRPCVLCYVQNPHFLYYKCGSKWMCLKRLPTALKNTKAFKKEPQGTTF